MLEVEERLFDKYKRVDNICRDMFSGQSGISEYITEMERNPFYGRSAAPLWDEDYRRLKRAQWLRNQIAHESSATDCNEDDVAWLEEFHIRLLERQDPLALLGKANRERLSSPLRHERERKADTEDGARDAHRPQRKEDTFLNTAVMVLVGMTAVAFLIFLWMMGM